MILLTLAFFAKKSVFCDKDSTYIQTVWELCNKFFSYIFNFCKIKVAIIENVSFINYASGIRLPDCSKLAINWKNDNDATTLRKFINFFWPCSISLVTFSYWPKFHVNIMTGVTKIFAYKGLITNLEIVNTSASFLPSMPGLRLLPFLSY